MANIESKQKISLAGLWKRVNVRLSHKERLIFTKYLSVLLRSGLAIDEAVEVLGAQSKGPLKKIIADVSKTLARGDTLADGLSIHPQVFSPVYINLIGAGEASGTLQENLEHLVHQLQKDYDLRQKVRGAMIYPMIIVASAVLISIGIVVFVLPNITGIFDALSIELPLPTKILLLIANLFGNHSLLVVLGLGVLIILLGFIKSFPPLKPFFHRILLALPIIGGISRMVNLARLTRLMGTMIKSGMSIDDTLPLGKTVLKNAQYRKMITKMEKEIAQGNTMSSVLEQYPFLIPPMAMRIIYVGEQSGTLEEMMLYLADFYEQEVDELTQNLSTIVEPFLLIFIGVLVGGLALSILMPIYQVVGSF